MKKCLILLLIMVLMCSGAMAAELKNADTKTAWDTSATFITLLGDSASIKGVGATADGGTVTITLKGTYVISGALVDGQIVIAAPEDEKVHLVLNGASITNETGAAIHGQTLDKLTITLEEGTENTLISNGTQTDGAALYCTEDLSINGTGYLQVLGNAHNGIQSKDDIVVVSGSLNVTAKNDGIHAGNSITIVGGDLTIAAGDDGVHADETLTIEAGNITVTQSYEGLEAANILISGGSMYLVSSDDGINAAGGADASGGWGPWSQQSAGAYDITITGGTVSLIAGGDGLDSNGTIHISGGWVYSFINSTPDNEAIDCDGSLTVTGGTIILGGSGVGQVPTGEQSYVYTQGSMSKGAALVLKKDGQEVATIVLPIDCSYLAFSVGGMTSGQSYELYQNGSLVNTITSGQGGGGMGFGHGGGGNMNFGGGGRRR